MKRANGEGSMTFNEQRQRYEYKISYEDPVTNEVKRRLFTSKKSAREAKKAADNFLAILNAQATEQPQTLQNWLEKWLTDYVENTVKIKTYERYSNLVKKNIDPYPIAKLQLTGLNGSLL